MLTGSLAAASNRADLIIDGEIKDHETDELVDLSNATFVSYICAIDTGAQLVSGGTSDGKLSVTGTGTFSISFTPDDLGVLSPGTYEFYLRATISGVTHQLATIYLPIVSGGPA